MLGLAVGDSEDGAFWTGFLRSLRARGLGGVRLVVSDAHEGLKDAIAAVLLGSAWQRCRVHFLRNVLSRIPRASAPMVLAVIRTIFAQPDAAAVREQFDEVVASSSRASRRWRRCSSDAREDLLAFSAFPVAHWKKVWSTNPLERVNKEIKPAHRRGRHLPQRRGHHAARRGGPARAPRRVAGEPTGATSRRAPWASSSSPTGASGRRPTGASCWRPDRVSGYHPRPSRPS